MPKFIIPVLILAALGIAVASFLINRTPVQTPKQAQEAPIKRTEITVNKDGFSPQSLKIKKSETVVWVNKSGKNVTVNSDPHPTHDLHSFLNRGEFASESSVQVTFDKPGTFTYHNHLNPSQKGTIVVE